MTTPARSASPLKGVVAAALLATTCLAACGIGAPSDVPPSSFAPLPSQSASAGIEVTRAAIEAALRARALGLVVPVTPFRPPESPTLIDASRAIFQVVLPDDPSGGYLVIYEFPDPGAARAAGLTQAAWLASGPGAVNFPLGTTHVIRQVASTLVTFSYPPAGSPDAGVVKVGDVLSTLGLPIPVGP
jgi:hypothetical protein